VVALPEVEVGQLPNPEPRPLTQIWHAYVAGVGGMGINVVASVLAQAGMRQGHAVRLTNKKGLAVRNGSVYSHLSFAPPGLVISPMIPWGQADLLLGLDVLEAARGVDPRGRHRIASPESTTALLNTAKTPTVSTLTGEEDFSPAELSTLIGHHTRPGGLVALDLFLISETYLGNKLYANVMMLGMAFQLGLLPLELETLEAALGAAVRRDLATNAKAFAMGRRLAIDPDHFPVGEPPETLAALRDRLEGYLRRGRGGATAAWYRRRADEALARLELDERTREHLVRRLHDLVQYEGTAYAEEYLERVERVHRRDSAAHAWQATRAVVHGLADAMVIKDEVYVAHLLTCEEKYERDRRRYRVDPSRGDRLVYRHLTRPHLRLFGRDVRPDLEVGDGLLRILARGRFLRRWLASWWHVEERGFRDWYAGLVDRFAHRDAAEYRTWVELLRLPEQVRGYRAVRAPRMAAARRRAEELLARRPAADSTGRTEIEPVPARQRQPAGA
jgi:indolepyruvate ferredoxin oxidoreductase